MLKKESFIATLIREKGVATIQFIGDSITYGCQHCTKEETYVAAFAKLMSAEFPKSKVVRYDGIYASEYGPLSGFEVSVVMQEGTEGTINIIRNGIGGNTVRRAIDRIDDFTNVVVDGLKADLDVFMFGINDALRGDPKKYVLPSKFNTDYCELLDMVSKRDAAQFVLMTPTFNGPNLGPYADEVKNVAEKYCLLCVDQHKLWLDHYQKDGINNGQGEWLSTHLGDACHPTPAGAFAIASYAFCKMKEEDIF